MMKERNASSVNRETWLRGRDLNPRPLGYEKTDFEGNQQHRTPARVFDAPLGSIICGNAAATLPQPFSTAEEEQKRSSLWRGIGFALLLELCGLAALAIATVTIVLLLQQFVGAR